jgi:bifunctional DNA-binding transcriptional regulator/antitoxin component of YhaV-PrlF toxin-antitoxin module
VLPVGIRRSQGLAPGAVLTVVESAGGIVIMTRQQLKQRVRADYSGGDLLAELLTERRAAAALEDHRAAGA